MRHVTHCENGLYFGLVTTQYGFEYYLGPFKSRSTARRKALKALAQKPETP